MKRFLLSFFLLLSLSPLLYTQILNDAINAAHQNRFTQALGILKNLYAKSPQDSSVVQWLAYVYLRMGDTQNAVTWLEKAVKLSPKSVKMWTDLAFAYNATHQPKLALDAYQEIIKFEPRNASIWYNIGILYDSFKNYNQAAIAFKKAIEYDPFFANAYFNLGKVYQQKRDFKEAARLMQKASQLIPEEALFAKAAAYSYQRANDKYAALPVYEHLQKLTLHYGPFLVQLSSLYYDVRRFADSLKLLERFVYTQEHDSSFWFNLALVQNQNDLLAKAETSYKKAIDLNPHNLMAIRNYAILLFRDHKYAEVIPWLRKLIEIYPNESIWKKMLTTSIGYVNLKK